MPVEPEDKKGEAIDNLSFIPPPLQKNPACLHVNKPKSLYPQGLPVCIYMNCGQSIPARTFWYPKLRKKIKKLTVNRQLLM